MKRRDEGISDVRQPDKDPEVCTWRLLDVAALLRAGVVTLLVIADSCMRPIRGFTSRLKAQLSVVTTSTEHSSTVSSRYCQGA